MTAGKRRLIIPAVLGALWLCAFALLVATESRSMIRENTAEITAECQTLWTMVKDAAAGNTADAARIAAYQQAMAGEAGGAISALRCCWIGMETCCAAPGTVLWRY